MVMKEMKLISIPVAFFAYLLVLLQMINLTSLIFPTEEKNSSMSLALTR